MPRLSAAAVVKLAYTGRASHTGLARAASSSNRGARGGITVNLDDELLETLQRIGTGRREPGLVRLAALLDSALNDQPSSSPPLQHLRKESRPLARVLPGGSRSAPVVGVLCRTSGGQWCLETEERSFAIAEVDEPSPTSHVGRRQAWLVVDRGKRGLAMQLDRRTVAERKRGARPKWHRQQGSVRALSGGLPSLGQNRRH